MSEDGTRNRQSGATVAQSTDDAGQVAAGRDDGTHYEADPDQIVKVVHQVRPATLPVEGPTDYARRGGPQGPGVTDVAVTPETPSVREARPNDDDSAPPSKSR